MVSKQTVVLTLLVCAVWTGFVVCVCKFFAYVKNANKQYEEQKRDPDYHDISGL